MDTSDSEYFESADEEFTDEIEDSKESLLVSKKLEDLKLSEENINTNFDNTITSEVKRNNKAKVIPKNVDTEENISTKIVENQSTNVSQSELCDKTDTMTKNKACVQEVLECNAVQSCKTNLNDSTELKCFENNSSFELNSNVQNSVQGTIKHNLWENDGWEIEEEIDHPEIKHQTLCEKDPLNTSSENLWENPEWEELETPLTTQTDNAHESWGSWGNWGMTSLLTTATQSVSTITNQVSQGLSTVLETGIGIPSPEQLAKMNHEEEKKSEMLAGNIETNTPENSVGFVLGNFGSLVSGVSNITKFVENTGTKVISGGLETLENIGKKTMEVLQEGDPGLKKKRAFLKLEQEKPILSQVLREAKEKAEQENIENKYKPNQFVKKKVNYEALFDDNHGLVHLEALEMLSKQCELKLKTLCDNCSGDALIEIQETIDQIKELCELPDEDEDEQLSLTEIKERLQLAVNDINVNISYEKLISCWEEAENWLESLKTNICSDEELHHQAIETLAQLTALAVEQYHKAGELLLIKDHHSTADEADSLVQ